MGESILSLRAVVFDFGMVLSGQPDQEAYEAMLRITGLDRDRFETLYWADRLDYDAGKLTGRAFWQKLVRDAGLKLDAVQIEELHRQDAIHWTTQNPAMLAWAAQLKAHGLLIAILSNMGDSVLANMQKKFDWLSRFDVLVWSFQLGMVKPDAAIYCHLLEKLATRAEETLFLDDRPANVEAAEAIGILAIQFSTIGQLRKDLIARGLDKELPLPA
jgi:putative hydrolase of the HAD superfamily